MPSEFERDQMRWRVLREVPVAGDTTDWVGTNAAPDAAEIDELPLVRDVGLGNANAIEVAVFARNSSDVILNRGSCTFTLTLIELIDRSNDPGIARGTSAADGLIDSAALTSCSLQTKYRVPLNGAKKFTLRVHTVASAPGTTDHFQVWYREVVE